MNNGTSKVDGVVNFTESGKDILVTGSITGLSPGKEQKYTWQNNKIQLKFCAGLKKYFSK